ncbi:hypothetical protein EV426DRAFT_707139 [Tirmania nivea]|nr:hypothetical protein EV426DRAFT_707139 [Tirmania nivea]
MRVITFHLVVLVALALCALAEPMYIAPTRIITRPTTDKEGWKLLFGRNIKVMLEARQNTGGGNNTNGEASNQLTLKTWAADAMEKCQTRLKNATSASNPAGIAACYNIATFDRTKWTFLADLKLFKVSAPDKDWEAIGMDVQVGIIYKAAGAEEMPFANSTVVVTDGPQFVKEFYIGGQVSQSFQRQNASDAEMRQILSPDIEVVATKKDGTQLRTPITTNEAMFITGQFAVSAPQQSSVPLPAKPEPFPGTKIAIMPIGLIFYSTYMVIGVSIVMYGTLERRKFRDQYRERVAQSIPGVARI